MNPNDLLLWLSAKGHGTWGRFRAAVDELQVMDESNGDDEDLGEGRPDANSLPIHHRLRLNLERLAHAEFFRRDFENGWRVVPPVLACVEDGDGAVGILCGARTENLIECITDLPGSCVTSRPECPDRVEITAETNAELELIAQAAGLHFAPNAARMLLGALPPVDDWQLRTAAEFPFGSDWEVHCFSPESFQWSQLTADEARSSSFGLFRFQVAHQPQYFISLRKRGYRIPVQVGKYLVLKRRRHRVLAYDAETQVLSMPVSCRPPLLVDRALTLCSGLIPDVDGGRLVYRRINKSIAMAVTGLLRQA
ncbi:MAG: hypothetical protein J5J06_00030 [Phycisphaerae bacterium]|nr:hypothetical protein [Phycisphaerae bacterium]